MPAPRTKFEPAQETSAVSGLRPAVRPPPNVASAGPPGTPLALQQDSESSIPPPRSSPGFRPSVTPAFNFGDPDDDGASILPPLPD
jgi:hypothetical protein